MPEIEITGDGTARGVWAMFDYVEWPENDGVRNGLQGYGHYREEYRREDGAWRISRIRLERLRIDWLGSPARRLSPPRVSAPRSSCAGEQEAAAGGAAAGADDRGLGFRQPAAHRPAGAAGSRLRG